MIPWTQIPDEDVRPLHNLAVRASKLADRGGFRYPVIDANMDLMACHLYVPLDLPALAGANDLEFAHDVVFPASAGMPPPHPSPLLR